jgi:predicted GNAT family N-acyltransferase
MGILQFSVSREFDLSMDRLRVECFPEEGWGQSARDRYDGVSLHVVARCGEELAGYARLTPAVHNYLHDKLGPQAPLPDAAQSIDIGRAAVAPTYRGHLLFELLLVEALLLAAEHGYGHVVSSCRPERRFRGLLLDLGFENAGRPVQVKNHSQVCLLQPLVASVCWHRDSWPARKASVIDLLQVAGYHIADSVLAPA